MCACPVHSFISIYCTCTCIYVHEHIYVVFAPIIENHNSLGRKHVHGMPVHVHVHMYLRSHLVIIL